MAYTRTNIYLTQIQKDGVKYVAAQQGVKPAELIRRIIDSFLKRRKHA